MSLKQKATSGILWTLMGQFGIQGINFFVQILLARIIAPEEFSIYGLLVIFNAIGNTISESGMGLSLIRTDNPNEKDYGTVFILNLSVSILIYLIIFVCAPLIAEFYGRPEIINLVRVYSLAIILTSFSSIQIQKLTKELNFKKQTIIQIPSLVIAGIVGYALGKQGYGVWALVIMNFTQHLMLSLQYWFLTGWRPKLLFSKERFHYHFGFGNKMLFSYLLNTLRNNIYPNVIAMYNPVVQVGYYNRANSMKNIPVQSLMSAIDKVSFPILAEIKNETSRLHANYIKMIKIALMVITPFMLTLVLVAKPLFIVLLTDVWLPAVPLFQLLSLVGFTYPISLYNLNMIKVKGRSDLVLTANVYKTVIALVLLFITAPLGMYALIYGLMVASLLSLFINQYFSAKVFKYSILEQTKDIIQVIYPSFIILAILYWVRLNIGHPTNKWADIFTFTLLFIVSYIPAQFFLNRAVFKELLSLTKGFLKIIKR